MADVLPRPPAAVPAGSVCSVSSVSSSNTIFRTGRTTAPRVPVPAIVILTIMIPAGAGVTILARLSGEGDVTNCQIGGLSLVSHSCSDIGSGRHLDGVILQVTGTTTAEMATCHPPSASHKKKCHITRSRSAADRYFISYVKGVISMCLANIG